MVGIKTHSGFHAFILLTGTISATFSADCDLSRIGDVLDCSGMTDFPIGSYREVETINFSRNNFTKLSPFIFYNHKFHNLKRAILRHCNIRYIHPDAFGMMSSITQLDLYGNRLATFHKNSFSGLTSLKYLHLGQNQIESTETEMLTPLPSLVNLDLSHNAIKNLTTDFLIKRSVSELDLSHNPLQVSEGAILESSSLTQLSLRSCNLTKIPEEAFGKLPLLQVLDLSRNQLDSVSDVMFKPLKELKQLDISDNNLVYVHINVLELPISLNAVLCNGNPENPHEGLNCSQLLRDLQNKRRYNVTEQVLFEIKLNESAWTTLPFTYEPRRNKRNELFTTSKANLISTELNQDNNATEEVLKRLICAVTGGCVVLLVILLVQICYLSKQKYKRESQ